MDTTPGNGHPPSELETLIRARYPLLYLVTWEERRVEEELLRLAKKLNKNAFTWTISRGLVPTGTPAQAKKVLTAGTNDPLSALGEVLERMDPALYLFLVRYSNAGWAGR